MPIRLLDRRQPESIQEFRAAARQRYDDGLSLAASGRRTGAVYLWGYSAEMLIKAAYFSAIRVPPTYTITLIGDLYPAMERGRAVFSIAWPRAGRGHNIQAWAELLVLERIHRGIGYARPFALQVQRQATRIYQLWSETLRYHKNVAYVHEVVQVRRAVEWFLVHAKTL